MKLLNRNCFVCDSINGTSISIGKYYIASLGSLNLKLKVCKKCGSVFQNEIVDEETMGTYYKKFSNYLNQSLDNNPNELNTDCDERLFSVIQDNLKTQSVYDIGCATGHLLNKLKSNGWKVGGCDPSPEAVKIADKKYDIKLDCGLFDEIIYKGYKTDLIVLSHVLEHVYYPGELLKKAYQLLSEDGSILIEVPCFIAPEKWPNGYFTFEHINIFSENSLMNILKNNGFDILFKKITTENIVYPVITILAQKNGKNNKKLEYDNPLHSIDIINTFLNTDFKSWVNIENKLINKLINFNDIIIWGGGVHTSQLLNFTNLISIKNILCIYDSNESKYSEYILKYKITPPDFQLINRNNIAVVISSKASENEIAEFLHLNITDMNKIIKIYS